MGIVGSLAAILACALPGAALVRREEWERAEPLEVAALVLCGSASFWAVAIWLQPWLGLSLTALALLVVLLSAAVLAARRDALRAAVDAVRRDPAPAAAGLALVAAVVAMRLGFALTRLACSVGDMSQHAYTAELIVMKDGMPATHEPLLPIDGFGQLAPGFHVLAAIETLLAGAPIWRSAIHAACLSAAALTFATYAVLRALGLGRGPAAIGAVAASFLARNPQFFLQWGGVPTLLAAAIAILLFRDALRVLEGRRDPAFLARTALLAAGVVLTHLIPVASFIYVFGAFALVRLARDRAAWGPALRSGAIVAALALLLTLPYALAAPLSTTPAILEYARAWVREEARPALTIQGPLLRGAGMPDLAGSIGAHTWPFYVVGHLGILPAALLLAGLAAAWRRGPRAAAEAATTMVAANAVLFVAAFGELLPLWPSFYPTRIGIWLAVALAAGTGALAEALAPRIGRRTRAALAAAWLGAFAVEGHRLSGERFGAFFYEAARSGRASPLAIAANEAAGGAFWIVTFSCDNAVLTEDDLRAFAWIREHVPPDAVFDANHGDGGHMIPAIAHRKVLEPHVNLVLFYGEHLRRWRESHPVEYIYVGAGSRPSEGTRRYSAERLDADPSVELVFRSGEARVYGVRKR